MSGKGVDFVLGDYCAAEVAVRADEEDMPEATLFIEAGEVTGFEMD